MIRAPQTAAGQALLASCAFFLLYTLTVSPTVTWEDAAAYHRWAAVDRPGDGGASVYRPYILLLAAVGKLPIGGAETFSLKLNLFHGLLSSMALGVLFALVRRLSGGDLRAAWGAAVALGVSHLFWHYAVVTKVYPLLVLLLLVAWYAAARWAQDGDLEWGAVAGLCVGFGGAVHPLFLVSVPGLAVALVSGARRKGIDAPPEDLARVFPFLAGAAGGITLLICFYAYEFSQLGLVGTLRLLLFSGHGDLGEPASQGAELLSIDRGRLARNLVEAILFLGYQFVLAVPLGILGFYTLIRRRRWIGWGLLIAYLTNVLVALDFNVPLKINFYLPSFALFAVAVGLGLPAALDRLRFAPAVAFAFLALAPPALYATFTFGYLRNACPAFLYDRPDAAYKDRGRFYFWPPKSGFRETETYACKVFSALPPGAFVLADFQEHDVLRYFQRVHGLRPDVTVRHVWVGRGPEPIRRQLERQLGERPVFIGAAYAEAARATRWRLVPARVFPTGDFHQVITGAAIPALER